MEEVLVTALEFLEKWNPEMKLGPTDQRLFIQDLMAEGLKYGEFDAKHAPSHIAGEGTRQAKKAKDEPKPEPERPTTSASFRKRVTRRTT